MSRNEGEEFFFYMDRNPFCGNCGHALSKKSERSGMSVGKSRVVDGYERSVEKLDARKEEEIIAQTRAYNVMLLEQNNLVPNDKKC